MNRYFVIPFFILLLGVIFINIIVAADEKYYVDLLKYGTDSDIEKAFTNVNEDLGYNVNNKVLEIFKEEHTEKVYITLVQYVGIVKLKKAHDVLLDELSRRGRNDDYRETVIHAIGKLGNSSSIAPLNEVYSKSNTSIRIKKAIVDAYGQIGDRSIEARLIEIVGDEYEDIEVRARAILALGEIKSKESINLLQSLLHNKYEEKILRMYSASSLSKIGGELSLAALAEVINDETHEVAEYAVNGIAKMETEKGGEYLIKALRSDYDKVRYYAILGLSKIKYRKAVNILEFKAEYDSNELIRKEAAKALENILGTEKKRETIP
jgi:HEAT repeat protein